MSKYTHVIFSFGRSFEGIRANTFSFFGDELAPNAKVIALALEWDNVPEGIEVIRVTEDGRAMGELPLEATPLFVVNGGTTPQQWAMASMAAQFGRQGKAVNAQIEGAKVLAPMKPNYWTLEYYVRVQDNRWGDIEEKVSATFSSYAEAMEDAKEADPRHGPISIYRGKPQVGMEVYHIPQASSYEDDERD